MWRPLIRLVRMPYSKHRRWFISSRTPRLDGAGNNVTTRHTIVWWAGCRPHLTTARSAPCVVVRRARPYPHTNSQECAGGPACPPRAATHGGTCGWPDGARAGERVRELPAAGTRVNRRPLGVDRLTPLLAELARRAPLAKVSASPRWRFEARSGTSVRVTRSPQAE